MALLRAADYANFHYVSGLKPDPRTKDWILVNNLGQTLGIVSLYLLVVWLGPKVMRSMKPFELKKTIIVYNAFMVIFNAYVFYLTATGGWLTHYKFLCQPVGAPEDPLTHTMAVAQFYYLASKFIELLDTVFFVLRKKDRQVTFLHVYHHFSVLLMVWCSVRYLPGGHITFMSFVNSFVHVVMYSYYLLSLLGPSVQKYLWWKKYLTRMQLTQFAVVIMQSLWVLHPSCDYPKPMMGVLIFNTVLFAYLFVDFYNQNYKSGSNKENIIIQAGSRMGNVCIPHQDLEEKSKST